MSNPTELTNCYVQNIIKRNVAQYVHQNWVVRNEYFYGLHFCTNSEHNIIVDLIWNSGGKLKLVKSQ